MEEAEKKLRRTFSNRVRTTDIPRSPRHPPIGRLSPGPGVRGPEAETRRIRGQGLGPGVEMLGDLTHSASRPGPAPRTLVILPTLISTVHFSD